MKQSLYLSLAYEDAPAAIDWLQGAFGFEPHLVVPGENGQVLHAELATETGELFMLLSTQLSTKRNSSPRGLGGTSHTMYVAVADIDKTHARAVEAGAELFNPLHDTDHGREFCCFDVEGHIWTFGEYRPNDTEG